MALTYCEVCGVLIKGGGGTELPEGVICDECFASRRVEVDSSDQLAPLPETAEDGLMQFECIYCYSLLRIQAVRARTRIKCPSCSEFFFVTPDGKPESRLQGNTTAILSHETNLPSLTSSGSSAVQMGDKTQPISKPHMSPSGFPTQSVPSGPSGLPDGVYAEQTTPDADLLGSQYTDAEDDFVRPGEVEAMLDLLPEGQGPGDVQPAPEDHYELRPSDEGRIDLDTERLRRKTSKFSQADVEEQRKKRKKKRKKKKKKKRRESDSGEWDDEESSSGRKKKKKKKTKRELAEEKKRRANAATQKFEDLESRKARRALAWFVTWSLLLIPSGFAGLLVSMTEKGSGFATRGGFGTRLEGLGAGVDAATRSMNGLLPEGQRLPGMAAERPLKAGEDAETPGDPDAPDSPEDDLPGLDDGEDDLPEDAGAPPSEDAGSAPTLDDRLGDAPPLGEDG